MIQLTDEQVYSINAERLSCERKMREITGHAVSLSIVIGGILTKPTPQIIIDLVCRHFDVKESEVCSRMRSRKIVDARNALMFFLRYHIGFNWSECSNAVGLMNHTSAIHGTKQAANLIDTDEKYALIMQQIEMDLKSF